MYNLARFEPVSKETSEVLKPYILRVKHWIINKNKYAGVQITTCQMPVEFIQNW
jgi:hypothetical protein